MEKQSWVTVRSVLAGLSTGLIVLACSASLGEKDKFVRVFLPDGQVITAELAVTDEERARGLMFREQLGSDQGMLFVFKEEGFHSFWMKNTLIPLDILWLDKDKRIVHIEKDVPPCPDEPCPSYSPRVPALYVLEMKAGSVEERGLNLFDRTAFILSQNRSSSLPSSR